MACARLWRSRSRGFWATDKGCRQASCRRRADQESALAGRRSMLVKGGFSPFLLFVVNSVTSQLTLCFRLLEQSLSTLAKVERRNDVDHHLTSSADGRAVAPASNYSSPTTSTVFLDFLSHDPCHLERKLARIERLDPCASLRYGHRVARA